MTLRDGADQRGACAAWRACRGSEWEEEDKERAADRLLRLAPHDRDRPSYSERQLTRHRCERDGVSLSGLEGILPDARGPQPAFDELRFLSSVSPLTRRERYCLRAWMLGWTQREMEARLCGLLEMRGQSQFSRCLRSALAKCYAARGLSFAQFSRHTVYRRPAHRRGCNRQRED